MKSNLVNLSQQPIEASSRPEPRIARRSGETPASPHNVTRKSNQTCRLVQAGTPFQGKQGLMYASAISADSVGAQHIHMQMLTIPPGGRAKAHKHESHETAIYIISGEAGVWFGGQLEDHAVTRTGDFFYIPADVPHLPYNSSKTEACVAIIARTDPNEQESVVLLPHLESIHPA